VVFRSREEQRPAEHTTTTSRQSAGDVEIDR
jgi:hypothetical protein